MHIISAAPRRHRLLRSHPLTGLTPITRQQTLPDNSLNHQKQNMYDIQLLVSRTKRHATGTCVGMNASRKIRKCITDIFWHHGKSGNASRTFFGITENQEMHHGKSGDASRTFLGITENQEMHHGKSWNASRTFLGITENLGMHHGLFLVSKEGHTKKNSQ